ncbi:MAG: hypothetical protein J7518_23410 [Nocardioidaceae bacterium]|nr:hypothetical protein [Nocardioidaceae bacterium]
MTTSLTVSAPLRRRTRLPLAVPVSIAVLVLVRALEVRAGASPDEGGFLVVAGQWHAGGSSLYGDYWVDRPPLLLAFYRLADLTGGLTSLRVIGAIAAAITVLLLASAALRVFGRRAATWTAVVAAALLVSPLFGSVDVNGELLAVPLVALGIRAAVEAVLSDDRLLARGSALVAGVAAVAALLVKQNVADVLVFTAVCWLVAWRQQRVSTRDLRDLVALAAFGAVLAYAVVMLSAMAHGTSPLEVYQATYPFRVEAARVLAQSTSNAADVRLHRLGIAFLLSAAPLVLALFAVFGLRRSRAPYVAWALAATAGWATVSVLAGGSYWFHYLVESIPVVALAAGAVSLAAPRLLRPVVAAVVVSALVAAGYVFAHPTATPGSTVGRAIAGVARPGDTLFSAFGDPDILRSTGMTSPYPYLWSLPARTLDPDETTLHEVLTGPDAPTWIVVRNRRTAAKLAEHGSLRIIENRYREVGGVCGRIVYLRRGVERPTLVEHGSCGGTVLP